MKKIRYTGIFAPLSIAFGLGLILAGIKIEIVLKSFDSSIGTMQGRFNLLATAFPDWYSHVLVIAVVLTIMIASIKFLLHVYLDK